MFFYDGFQREKETPLLVVYCLGFVTHSFKKTKEEEGKSQQSLRELCRHNGESFFGEEEEGGGQAFRRRRIIFPLASAWSSWPSSSS